jgi:sulfur-oxidizing protein SoxZ
LAAAAAEEEEMADDIKPRLRVPSSAKKGEVIEIKTLITHPMETGLRKDSDGKIVPRLIVNSLVVTYNDKPVLNAKLEPAVAANPYMAFFLKVEESGTLKFTWTDDNKQSWTAESKIEVA